MEERKFEISQGFDAGLQQYMTKVYGQMFFALLITAFVALAFYSVPAFTSLILTNPFVFYGALIGEFILVGYLSVRIDKISSNTAYLIFIAYAALNGVTISVLLLMFGMAAAFNAFLATALMFGFSSFYGLVTKKNLSGVGHFMLMGLVGIIVATLVNLFLQSPALYWAVTYLAVFIFIGLTAYDSQKIREAYDPYGEEGNKKAAIFGSLALYLDFINLFILLLRIFGDRD